MNVTHLQRSVQNAHIQASLISEMKKKERSLEKELKAKENLFTQNKKFSTTLQEMNRSLLQKVKELEESEKCGWVPEEEFNLLKNDNFE